MLHLRATLALLLLSPFALNAATTTTTPTAPALMLSDGFGDSVTVDATGTAVCTGSCATVTSTTAAGIVNWAGTLGVFNVNSAIGESKPALPGAQLSLALSVTTGPFGAGAGNAVLTAKWSDTGFNGVAPTTMSQSSTVVGTAVANFNGYIDSSNALFGAGTSIGTLGPVSANSSTSTTGGPGPSAQPFSMTAAVAITMGPNAAFTLTNFLLAAAPVQPLTLACPAATGQVGVAYNSPFVATGGVQPYTFSTTGTLPAGLQLNAATGQLSGTPTAFGTFNFTAQVVDSSNNPPKNTVKMNCAIVVAPALQITTLFPNSATAGGAAFPLTVVGTGFVNGSVVQWNGNALTTTYNSANRLTANVTANLIATAGNVNITVKNPNGTVSNALVFAVNPPAATIDSVEVVQTIQQLQTLPQLQASLTANGQPPVPIIANKTAVLRVYVSVPKPAAVNVGATIAGAVEKQISIFLQPNCTTQDRRTNTSRNTGCFSFDFEFVPAAGNWTISLRALVNNAVVAGPVALNFKNTPLTQSLLVIPVRVCDGTMVAGKPNCGDTSTLQANLNLARLLMPAPNVFVGLGAAKKNASVTVPKAGKTDETWFADVNRALIAEANAKGFEDARYPNTTGGHRFMYIGVSPAFPGLSGLAAGIGSVAPFVGPPAPPPAQQITGNFTGGARRASLQQSFTWLGANWTQDILVHEMGHLLGARHTNVGAPAAAGGVGPGCQLAGDPATPWPYADNQLRSGAAPGTVEVGYDFRFHLPTIINQTFDIMGYCTPTWIAPINYNIMLNTLRVGVTFGPMIKQAAGVSKPEDKPLPHIVAPAVSLWQVSGAIAGGNTTFDPLMITNGTDPGTGTGTYTIQVQDSNGAVLYTRLFTPEEPASETMGAALPVVTEPLQFFELIPMTAHAAKIVLLDPTSAVLGQITLSGAAPVVSGVTVHGQQPISGAQTVSWNVNGTQKGATVEYSADGGSTWTDIGVLDDENSLLVDFDNLPGSVSSNSSRLRVFVSDGANVGEGDASPFAVARKLPYGANIELPEPGFIFRRDELVILRGSAYDGDDGTLDQDSLSWTSSLNGPLGSGTELDLASLSSGQHTVTMDATDSDGNKTSTSVQFIVSSGPPQVTLTVNGNPSSCAQVTMQVQSDPNVPLFSASYSLDGGQTLNQISIASLPYTFSVCGSTATSVFAMAENIVGEEGFATTNLTTGP